MRQPRRLASVVLLVAWCAGAACPTVLQARSPQARSPQGTTTPPPRTSGRLLSKQQIGALSPARMRVYERLFIAPNIPSVVVQPWNGLSPKGTDMFGFSKVPVTADWRREDVHWWYRFLGAEPKAVAFVWQMGRFDFPPTAQNWEHPPGLLASGKVAKTGASGGWTEFQVDYTFFAPSPNGPRFDLQSMPKFAAKQPAHFEQQGKGNLATSARRPADPYASVRKAQPQTEAQASAIRRDMLALPLPATFYVRVVALDASGAILGRPSLSAVLTFAPPPRQSSITLFKEGFGHPSVSLTQFEPVRADALDCLCIYKVVRDIPNPMTHENFFTAGTYIDVCQPKDSSFLDDLGDAVSGFFDAMGSLVNWVAQAYESAKNALVNAVVAALKGTVGCGGVCQTLVSTALEAGLAAVGLPPTLPNFDQLVDMGADYLAAKIAAEAGIPENLAKTVTKAFVDQVRSNGGAAASGAWAIPDPDRQYRPGHVLVQVTNRGMARSQPVVMHLRPRDTSTYKVSDVPLPPLQPGQSISVPVFLNPVDDPSAWKSLMPTAADVPDLFAGNVQQQLDAYAQKIQAAASARAAWEQKYVNASTTFDVTTENPVGSTVFSQFTVTVKGSQGIITH